MTATELATMLHARRVGKGKWFGKCPVHAERTASVSIRDMGNRVAVKCFGCGATGTQIMEALGFRATDLFVESRTGTLSPEMRERLANARLLEHWIEKRKAAVTAFIDTRPKVPRELWGDAKDPDEFIRNGGNYQAVLDCLGDWWSGDDIPGWVAMTARITFIREKIDPELKIERERREKLDRFLAKFGWDRLWQEFMKTENGRAVDAQWGLKSSSQETTQ